MNSPRFDLVLHEDGGSRRMEAWRRNVGAPVALDLRSGSPASPGSLLVLSWNVWIGRGKLEELVTRIRAGDFKAYGAERDLPFVALIQEGYRSDESLPPQPVGPAGRVLVAQLGVQEDVAQSARALGLNLRYAPSMRNSTARSDRGNAILSSLPLEDAQAIELPLVLQRRVVVAASLQLGGSRIRLVSAHLDPRGPPGHRWSGAAGRAVQAQHLVNSLPNGLVVLGADLNLGRGRFERAWRVLSAQGFTLGVPPTSPMWRHTFHALPRLVLDYLLIRDPDHLVHRAKVHRLDEHPRDRGPRVFGSDHHPLLARIDFN
ncbi:MAG TPA: endonuclease/exonuclease/phosphatase family protein [Gemmatimonadales bacterium]|nr:endonuclease/exonuclease/phosphatase family protein [Gemmatimonadales bacterium]